MVDQVAERIEWDVKRNGDHVVIAIGEDELWLRQFEAKELVKAIMGCVMDIESSHWGLR